MNLVRTGLLLLALAGLAEGADAVPAGALRFDNGLWFDGESFQPGTFYSVGGLLTREPPPKLDEVVDLAGGWVIPPFGEAHNHNLESDWQLDPTIRRYLEQGVFYVKVTNNIGEVTARIAHRLNHPQSVDVIYANGGLTASGGHPVRLYEEILHKKAYSDRPVEWFRDRAFFLIDKPEDLAVKWPLVLAGSPGFIKIFLLASEEHAKRRDDPAYYGRKGLDPKLVPAIVERARAAGLRVSAHVETAADFHQAVAGGVDEVTHLPGYSIPAGEPVERYRIAEEDARLAARRGVVVVTTVALAGLRVKDPDALRRIRENQIHNLKLLRRHGVPLAVGTDHHALTPLTEIAALRELGIFDNRELLRLWCVATPRAIFPGRRIGRLAEGYEASFLVLSGNPLDNFDQVRKIRFRFKQGERP